MSRLKSPSSSLFPRPKRQQKQRSQLRKQLQIETLEERRVLTYAAEVLADSPIAYYRFEEAAGAATAVNSGTLGTAANGTVNNVTLGNASVLPGLGKAGTFANGNIIIPDSTAFDLGTGNYTLEFWFNSSNAARGDIFTNKGGGVDLGVHYASQGANTASLYHNGFITTTPPVLAPNSWHHAAIVRNGTGANQTVFYIDGIPASYGASGQNWNNANSPLVIGSNHNGNPMAPSIPFQGQIDEFAIYNKALTQSQIRNHIVSAFDSYGDFIAQGLNPSLYYEFNEAPGTITATDSSGNGRDGTLVNGPTLGVPSASLQTGTGIEFNGNQYITTRPAPELGLNGSFTASAWVKADALDGERSIFGTDTAADNQGLHLVLRSGQPYMGFYAHDLGSGASNIVSVGEWYHLAWKYDAASGEQSIYLNGAQLARGLGHAAFAGTGTVTIGRSVGGNYFDGRIDEAAIFPSALPHGAIQRMYLAGLSAHANDDALTTTQGTPVSATQAQLVANDQGVLAGIIDASGGAAGTTVSVGGDGALTYDPGSAFDYLTAGQTANDTLVYDVLMHEDYGNRRIVLGPYGPNGTYNAYMWDPVVRTWDEARVAGYSTRLNGVTGKLVEINTLAENNFLAQSFRNQDGGAGLDFWIGISDSDQRSAIDLVQLTGTEAGTGPLNGWHYASGGQITFSNWTNGEPNDVGGEDAAQMYTSGLWNDNQAGSSLGQADTQFSAIYEFELGLTDPADFVAPGFTVRQVRSSAGVGNLTDVANLLAAGSPNNIGERTMHYSVINMSGNGDGRFTDNLPYPFAGDGSNFAVEATGYVFIPAAGDYTFIANSDDGFSLTMPGSTLSGIVGDNGSTAGLNGVLRFNAGRGASDTLGVFNFPARGFYPIQVNHWEGGGGDSIELSAARGAFSAYDANAFSLVGDIAGLKVFNEIPTALLKSATVTVEVAGVDDAPTVTVGGPYTIVEGQNLALDSVGSDADAGQTATLAYAWDLDNDGQFDDATGANPTVDWNAVLRGLNYDGLNPPVAQTIRVQVTDSSGLTGVATTTVTVSNTAPTLTFNAPLGAPPGQDIDFPYTASDPAAPDAASLTLVVDWGDGASETVNNATAGTLTHAYAHDGNYTITATLTDKDGGEDEQTFDLNISPVFLDADGNLVVNGTSRSDRIILTQKSFGGVEVRLNNVRYTMAPDTNTVIVFAGRGSDSVTVYGRSTLNYILHGEGGNDYLAGGNEDDILDGGDGDDRLLGGLGNDILLGGNGNDRASGASGNDIIYGDGYLDEAGDIDVITDVQALYFPDNFAAFTEVLIFNDGVGRDTLAGDNDDDLIFGGAGNDRINGGNGNDRLWGEDGNDSLSGDNGDDLLAGGEGSDVLYGRAGNDVLIGGNAADRLYGYNGDDLLLGDGLDEMDLEDVYMLWLQNGVYGTQDILDSGSFTVVEDNAVDTLYGQSGADWFVLFNRDVARDARSDDAVDRDPMP